MKTVTIILVILGVPILFFQLLGGDLLSMNGTQKRVVAIVNEDLGDAKDEEKIEMGKEVISILEEDSPYEWKVMSRGAAENGLISNQYEAIVYIPSDFSENVMSYDERNPQKAEFSYQVQRQKSGERKEQVLDEIEKSTNRVNQRISTLYWSYVALEMDHIKKEFTNILEKETEFLDAMSAYYKPGSEKLAELVVSQKEQMEGLRSMIETADSTHGSQIENVESFRQQLDGFVSSVQQYKDFQGQQKEVLLQVQDSSLAKIQAAAAKQVEQFNETVLALENNNEKLNSEIQKVDEKIAENKQKFDQLSELRKQQVDRQLQELVVVQGTAIDRYNDSILRNLEQEMAAGKDDEDQTVVASSDVPQDQDQMAAVKEEMEQKAEEKSNLTLPDFVEEKKKMDDVLASLLALKTQVTETDPESSSIPILEQLETDLSTVKESISGKEELWSEAAQASTDDYRKATTDYGNLYSNYNTLFEQYKSVQDILNSHPADIAWLLLEIKEKESSLLNHQALTAEKRTQLEKLFAKGASSTETDALLSYYATLVQFGFTLDERVQGEGARKDEVLKDDIMQALLENVVNLSEDELEGWNTVGESIPETQLGVSDLSASFAAIMSGSQETIEMQHSALLTDLDAINEQANILLTQIQTPSTMIPSGEPVTTSGEGEVMAGQQNVSNELLSLSSMVNSLSEQQDGLVNYTQDLQVKANDIKETSTEFSTKWDTNTDSMSEFKEDIQGFLGNTYVDGQVNGYAFNHLVNPLDVKGEASVADEVKKVPPIILYIILLVSSLLIGYFSHTFKEGAFGLHIGMMAMLSVLVGLIISLYSVNMYTLTDDRAIEWTIFTVLLLLAGAATIRTALDFGQTAGWIASIALMCLYIIPLLILGVPDIMIPDILSTVYNSIKYEPETNFILGASITGMIAVVMFTISFFVNKRNIHETSTEDQVYES
jgi:putative membrane protein